MASTTEAKVVITGEDKSKPAFQSASKSTSILKTDVTGLTKALGGMAVAGSAAVVGFLYSAAKSAAAADVAMARVDSTLKVMGASALKNRDAILEAANAAVKLGFDDEDAAESITRLYQRTNDLSRAQEYSALAMDLSRAKSIDLATATGLVGQVLSGNTRALKEYGIALDDNKTPLQALGELHDMVKGKAVSYTETFQGRIDVLTKQMDNFKETIGAAVLTAVDPFITKLSAWASKTETQQKIRDISKAIAEFAEVALPVAIETLKIWKGAFDGIVDVISDAIVLYQRMIDLVKKGGAAVGNTGKAVLNAVGVGTRAIGGPVSANTPYLVGENGPELFVPSSLGTVRNSMGGLQTAGGMNITINVSGNTLLDESAGDKLGRQIMDRLKADLRI